MKVGGNVGGCGVQREFTNLEFLKKEMKNIKRRVDFSEQSFDVNDAIIQMEYAYNWAKRKCKAKRRKCGAVIYKDNSAISCGYNGTPSKESNVCEIEIDGSLVTKGTVIHAEANALYKLARKGISPLNSTLFVTTAPCERCAEQVSESGVSTVVFTELYRGVDGLEYLIRRGVSVFHLDLKKGVMKKIYQSNKSQSVKRKLKAIKKSRKMLSNYKDGDFHEKDYEVIV